MSAGRNIDGVLVQWGERLFFPPNRIVRPFPQCRLAARAAEIRARIEGVVRRSPQVIVKISGGGHGMHAICDHLRYITDGGTREFEDDRGIVREGKDALRDLENQWRHGGTYIPSVSQRREALNLMLAMPAGTPAEAVRGAAREFARIELAKHRYVMVLHQHQTSPHVHLCVKHESADGERFSIGRSDIKRWRETFAQGLRARGIEAEATPQAVRGATRNFDQLWQFRAKEEGRLQTSIRPTKSGPVVEKTRADALEAWSNILVALHESDRIDDRQLASHLGDLLCRTPYVKELLRRDRDAMPGVRRYLEEHKHRIEVREQLWRQERAMAQERNLGPERALGREMGLGKALDITRPGPDITR